MPTASEFAASTGTVVGLAGAVVEPAESEAEADSHPAEMIASPTAPHWRIRNTGELGLAIGRRPNQTYCVLRDRQEKKRINRSEDSVCRFRKRLPSPRWQIRETSNLPIPDGVAQADPAFR